MDKRPIQTEEIRNFFDKVAPERDYWRDRNRTYHQDRLRIFKALIPEGASILCLGCGTGDLLAELSPSRGVGVDLSPNMIRIAKEKYPNLTFHVGLAECLSLSETFDWIILPDLVGFLPDVQQVFAAFKSCVHFRTRIVVTHYNPLWGPAVQWAQRLKLKMPEPPQNWLTTADISNLMYLEGFETVSAKSRMLLPFGVLGLTNLVNRYLARLPLLKHLCLYQTVVARPMLSERNSEEVSCSVIVPCKNEKGTVADAVLRTPLMGKHTELIFVLGGSTDGTEEVVKACIEAHPDLDIKLMWQKGKGKGDAVRTGFDAAKGDVLMILDGDLTVTPEELPRFFNALIKGRGDLVVGCRLVYPMEHGAMRFLNLQGNRTFGWIVSQLVGQPLQDALCGTKVLYAQDHHMVKDVQWLGREDPFGDFDLLFNAAKHGRKIVQVPVHYQSRSYGATQIRRFLHGWKLFCLCWAALWRLKLTK